MNQRSRIGIFLAGTLLILAVMIFIVGDFGRFLRPEGYTIRTSFDTVAGLDVRAGVRLSGVIIGYVKDVRLEGPRPVVDMNIEHWAKVPSGSKATLSTLGLLGEKYIEILPSKSEAVVPPGGSIPSLASVSFDQIGLLMLSIGDEVKNVGAKVQTFLGPENAVRFGDVLESLAQTSQSLSEFIKNNRSGLDASLRSAEHALASLDSEVSKVAASFSDASRSLAELVSENREGIKVSVEKMKVVLDQIKEASERLSSVLQKLDKGEGSLGRVISDPELYDRAKDTLDTVRSTVSPFSRLRLGGDAVVEYYARSELWKGALTSDLWLAAGPFFMAQVVRDPFQTEGRKFSYSLEAGRRWGPVAPRIGVIESDFGVGLDYFAFRDRFELSLDAYDFGRHPQPRLRLTSRFYPSRYLFFVLGLDELIRERKREVFFGLGVGLR